MSVTCPCGSTAIVIQHVLSRITIAIRKVKREDAGFVGVCADCRATLIIDHGGARRANERVPARSQRSPSTQAPDTDTPGPANRSLLAPDMASMWEEA